MTPNEMIELYNRWMPIALIPGATEPLTNTFIVNDFKKYFPGNYDIIFNIRNNQIVGFEMRFDNIDEEIEWKMKNL